MKYPENEMKYRELNKLMDILKSWGNVAVNGGVPAQARLMQLCTELQFNGMTLDEIDEEIKTLEYL